MPDSRWILDLPQRRVLARSQKSAAARRRMSYGVAIVPTSRTNVVRNTYFNEGTTSIVAVPPPGFERIAVDRYFTAYARCPRPGA